MPFVDFIGNQRCVGMLQRGLQRGRLPHAMLFCGPEAVGKRLLALHLAAALNCRENLSDDGCGRCKDCRMIREGRHPDIVTLEPDGQSIKIEQIRELIHDAGSLPFHGKCKVFILEKAHAMQAPAANALLKILEEPLPSSKLILVSHQPDALLPTIRSRCQMFRFAPLTIEEVALILKRIEACSGEEAIERARQSEGSMAQALALNLKEHLALEDSVYRFLELAISGASFHQAAELVDGPAKEKELAATKDWLHRLFHAMRTRVVALSKGEASDSLVLSQWWAMAQAADEVRRGLEHNINRQLALENLFLTCRKIASR